MEPNQIISNWIDENKAHHYRVLKKVYPSWAGAAVAFWLVSVFLPSGIPAMCFSFLSMMLWGVNAFILHGNRCRAEAENRALEMLSELYEIGRKERIAALKPKEE